VGIARSIYLAQGIKVKVSPRRDVVRANCPERELGIMVVLDWDDVSGSELRGRGWLGGGEEWLQNRVMDFIKRKRIRCNCEGFRGNKEDLENG